MAQKWPTAEHGYLIERTDYPSPRFMSGAAADEGVQSNQMWGQDSWRAAVPHTYRLLAAPRAGLPFPSRRGREISATGPISRVRPAPIGARSSTCCSIPSAGAGPIWA